MRKAMTLRLDDEQAEDLAAIAQADGVTISEAVRSAIERHIDERRKDKAFKKRLKSIIAENQEILKRLAE